MAVHVRVVELEQRPAAVIRGRVQSAGLPEFLGGAFTEVAQVAAAQGLALVGPPFGRYRPSGDAFEVEVGFPVDRPPTMEGRVEPATLPAGPAATTTHTGAYDEVAAAFEAVVAWLGEHGYEQAGEPWECYLDGPEVPRPRTEVWVPVTAASA